MYLTHPEFFNNNDLCKVNQYKRIFCGNLKGQYSIYCEFVPKNKPCNVRCHHLLHFFNMYMKNYYKYHNNLINISNIKSIKNDNELNTIIQEKLKQNYSIFDTEDGNFVFEFVKGNFVKGIYDDKHIIFANSNNVIYLIYII